MSIAANQVCYETFFQYFLGLLMVLSTIILKPGVTNIQTGSDVTMIWNTSKSISNLIFRLTKNGKTDSVTFVQNITTKQFYMTSGSNNTNLGNIEVGLMDDLLSFTLRNVVLNDSQTFYFGENNYTINVYGKFRLLRIDYFFIV